jgi:hypothetical protein
MKTGPQLNSSIASNISLTFAQTPTNQFLNITNISCIIQVASDQSIYAITLQAGTASGVVDLGRPYSLMGSLNLQTVGNKYYSILTNQVFFKFGPGRFPTIEIDSSFPNGGSVLTNAQCTIVGNLTDN